MSATPSWLEKNFGRNSGGGPNASRDVSKAGHKMTSRKGGVRPPDTLSKSISKRGRRR